MAHPDPFLRSMALWVLRDYTGSLNTLLQTNVGTMHPQYSDEDKPDSASKCAEFRQKESRKILHPEIATTFRTRKPEELVGIQLSADHR